MQVVFLKFQELPIHLPIYSIRINRRHHYNRIQYTETRDHEFVGSNGRDTIARMTCHNCTYLYIQLSYDLLAAPSKIPIRPPLWTRSTMRVYVATEHILSSFKSTTFGFRKNHESYTNYSSFYQPLILL